MELDIVLSTIRQALDERQALRAISDQICAAYGDGRPPSIQRSDPFRGQESPMVDISGVEDPDVLEIRILSEGDRDDLDIRVADVSSPQESPRSPFSELDIRFLEDQPTMEGQEAPEQASEEHAQEPGTPDVQEIVIGLNGDQASSDDHLISPGSADLDFEEDKVERRLDVIKQQLAQSQQRIVELRQKQVQISNAFAQQDVLMAQQQAAALSRYDHQLAQQLSDQTADRRRQALLQQQIYSEQQRAAVIHNNARKNRKVLLIAVSAGTILGVLIAVALFLRGVAPGHSLRIGAAIVLADALVAGIGWLWIGFRSRELEAIRERISQMESNRQQLIAGEGSMSEWLQEQRRQEEHDFQLQRDALYEQNYQRPQEAIAQELRTLYRASMNELIPEGLRLIDAWLIYLAGRLRSWHADWSNPIWTGLDAQGLLERRMSSNLGLRVGILVPNASTVSVPAVIDPIGKRRHVFIRGGDGESRAALMREMVLRFVVAFPVGLARLLLIDGEEQGRTLSLFAAKLHQDIAHGQVYDREQTIAQELSVVRERITQITQHVLVDYDTLDDYNQANPEIALPYQFVVISNLPRGLDNNALRALQDIARNGPRAGVHILATIAEQPQRLHESDLDECMSGSYVLEIRSNGAMEWNSEYLSPYRAQTERPLAEEIAGKVLQTVGQAYELKPVVVRYERIVRELPPLWSLSTDRGLRVPVGLTFGGKLHTIEFNDEIVHGLIGGRTGSGKTVFLHDLICGLAQSHAPEDLELYLLDFKGTEFSVYARNGLPHARVVAVDCDVEVGLNIIKRLTAERDRRRQLFHEADVTDIQRYREKGNRLPRILLIIDELQMLTQAADTRLVQEIERNLVELLKLGRAAGIHVLMGTQSPSSVLSPQMLQQTAMRICLLADPQVSRLVLGETNEAASALQRQGEAVYNAYNGQREKNIFMRAALLERQGIAEIVSRLSAQASMGRLRGVSKLLYFDGGSRGSLLDHPDLKAVLENSQEPPLISEYKLPVGESIEIKDPTAVVLARKRYGNVILLGNDTESLHGLWRNLIVHLCILRPADTARFYVVDLTPADYPCATMSQAFSVLPQRFDFALSSADGVTLAEEVYALFKTRKELASKGTYHDEACVLAVFGMENFVDMRGADKYSKPLARQHLEEMLKEGPAIGIHCLIASQTLDRGSIISVDDFGQRICFQVSEDDSRALLDSDAGTKLLRADRAIYRRRDWPYGKVEKFKPYVGLDTRQLQSIAERLNRRAETGGGSVEQG